MSYSARALPDFVSQKRGLVYVPRDPLWCSFASFGFGGYTNVAWTTANTALGYWIVAPETTTVYRLGWMNGTTPGGNTDMGIYDSDGVTRLVSTGSTANSGASAVQMVDIVDTTLTAGKSYFVAVNHDSTTVSQMQLLNFIGHVNGMTMAGIKEMAVGSVTLPDPFVPATPSVNANLPVIFFETRSDDFT